MHRLAATPGGWNPQTEGVIFVEQTPAPVVFLTAADTDIQTLALAATKLPEGFPDLRAINLLQLQQQLSIDTYAEDVLAQARIIIIRLLGGRAYWSYGLEAIRELVKSAESNFYSSKTILEDTAIKKSLIVLPGDDRPDPDLLSYSNIPLGAVDRLWRYFTEGGVENFAYALQFATDVCLGTSYNPPAPQTVPRAGSYPWSVDPHTPNPQYPKVGVLFYRAHFLAGNTAPIDILCQALMARELTPVPVFASSGRDPEVQAELAKFFCPTEGEGIQLLLNTTSFSISGNWNAGDRDLEKVDRSQFTNSLLKLDVPVLQVILSSGTEEQWQERFQGLSPRDLAMNVALPEVDGRIITRAISFKAVQVQNPALQTDVVIYQPEVSRINFVADLAKNWVRLRQTPPAERKVALILANYPNRDGRLANGVGLDTPASCVEILQALQLAGYQVGDFPQNSEELMARLTSGVTNDPEGQQRPILQSLSAPAYQEYFTSLPAKVQGEMTKRWGLVPETNFPIPGIQLGNIFVGIQPARGYDLDPSLNYHAPDLEPTHNYLAYYYWLRSHFSVHAIVHVGKHGNLEWLPGKSVALSDCCYPEIALGALPHLYPFIVNDPGEGSQAKRRGQAVIIDHLTPPMTRAELYGGLQQLEGLIDEYYEAQSLNPSRLPAISDRICQLIIQENLQPDFGKKGIALSPNFQSPLENSLVALADGYLCELKEAQIRDGLHILGQCPQGRQLRDLAIAIARHPSYNRLGLTRALAADLGWDFDPLTDNPAQPIPPEWQIPQGRIIGDAIAFLEELAADIVDNLIAHPQEELKVANFDPTQLLKEWQWLRDRLLPALQQTSQEITYLLRGLDGCFVPSAPSGAPTRGRPEVLPTGRNFYSVDIRAIPTETAWDVGRKAAEILIESYVQDNGEYPKTLGLSVWGTSTMRTGGDDLAEALALLGVRPVWDGAARRVVDFEILPLSSLGRPRVDVTLRISGFFRDAFPNLIDLFDRAVIAVAALPESPAQNPLAAQVQQETQYWQTEGLNLEQATARSHYRIFGSKPGAYGAGLQGLIAAQNWQTDADLARAYINWSCYAYTATSKGGLGGNAAPEAFEQRLRAMQVVLHNQDNREHDLLDSDDYYQFQGGLTVSIRTLTGKNPQTYLGDHSTPSSPKIHQLSAEILRVYRSRVINPKWIAGVMRHGYKGAFEMAATVDYLFAYDATARCVEDFMYQGVAEAYLLDPTVQEFVQQKNPWALRDMAERLLEAQQRGLWDNASSEILEELKAIARQAEAAIESTIPLASS